MALTRTFKETVKARAESDSSFRKALLVEAVELLIEGDLVMAKSTFRDYINATLGFEGLGKKIDMPSKSLMRMFSSKGNPQLSNFIDVLIELQKYESLKMAVYDSNEVIESEEPSTGIRAFFIDGCTSQWGQPKSNVIAFRPRVPAQSMYMNTPYGQRANVGK